MILKCESHDDGCDDSWSWFNHLTWYNCLISEDSMPSVPRQWKEEAAWCPPWYHPGPAQQEFNVRQTHDITSEMTSWCMTIFSSFMVQRNNGLHLDQKEAAESAYERPITWDAACCDLFHIFGRICIFFTKHRFISYHICIYVSVYYDTCWSTWNTPKLWIYHVLPSHWVDKHRQSFHWLTASHHRQHHWWESRSSLPYDPARPSKSENRLVPSDSFFQTHDNDWSPVLIHHAKQCIEITTFLNPRFHLTNDIHGVSPVEFKRHP